MSKLYDICVATSKYTNNYGKEVNRWENVGSVVKAKDNNTYIMLKAHFNPAAITRLEGSECICLSLFPPKENQKNNNPPVTQTTQGQRKDFDRNTIDFSDNPF